ncbi:MAG: protein phosphatase 2C domain-containing protein [Clostridia bacterium]|nr:protein phosphatase 2C domain-containing protein [Clostridia bacterium]
MTNFQVSMLSVKSTETSHKVNEDHFLYEEYSFCEGKKLRLIVICDGMGGVGMAEGDQASLFAVQAFSESIHRQLLQAVMRDGLDFSEEGFETTAVWLETEVMPQAAKEANQAVYEKTSPLAESGTTLTAILVIDHYAVLLNVGDSPAYFYDAKSGELILVSQLQTLAELEVQEGRYEKYSEAYYDSSHILSHCLGEYDIIEKNVIYVRRLPVLCSGDMILAGSDGAFGRMGEQKILATIKRNIDNGRERFALKRLFLQARRDKKDDQTAVLLCVQ